MMVMVMAGRHRKLEQLPVQLMNNHGRRVEAQSTIQKKKTPTPGSRRRIERGPVAIIVASPEADGPDIVKTNSLGQGGSASAQA